MGKRKIGRLMGLLALVLVFSFAAEGVSAFAGTEQTRSAQGTFNRIVNNMGSATPGGYGNSADPYGYGVNVPFTMSPSNELVVFAPDPSNYSWNTFYSYDGLSYGSSFLSSGTKNRSYTLYWHTGGMGTYRQTINAPQMISFDPTGTGRKDHVAVLGVSISAPGASHLYLYVYDANGNSSAEFDMGQITWMEEASGLDYYNVKNYYSVTAGDYDGNGQDTLVVYACLDGWNLGLFEVNVSSSGGSISLSKRSSSPSYSLLMREYSGGVSGIPSDAPYFNTWANGNDLKTKLCGQVATGDLNGDRIDDLAVLTWHGGEFIGAYTDDIVPSAPYVAVRYGTKGSSGSVVSGKTAGMRVLEDRSGDSSFSYNTIAAPGLAVGDVTGNGRDDVVVAGYLKKLRDGDTSFGAQSVDKTETVIISYQTSDGSSGTQLALGPNTLTMQTGDKLTTSGLMNSGFYTDDTSMNYSSVAVVQMNGKGNPGYVFVNGLLAAADGQSFVKKIYGAGLDSTTESDGYYNSRKSGFSNRWIDSVAVGNFDGDIQGTEEVVYTIGLKTSGKDQYQFDMGEMGGTEQHTNFVQIANFPAANTTGALRTDSSREVAYTVCSVDNDSDGIVARYKDKGYVYSDPEVMAVIQAAPYFEELQDCLVDTNSTQYSISESFELEQGTSNSVSFGAGLTHNLEGTLGGYEVTAGYAMEWSEEFTNSQATSVSYSWQANFDDAVVVYRTPVILYRYEIMTNGTWDADYALTIAVPGAASYEVIPIDDYNEFAAYYNQYYADQAANASPRITEGIPHLDQITDPYLGHEGDPTQYRSTEQAGYTLLQKNRQKLSIGSTSTGFDYSQEEGYSTSTSMSHGFSFELTITFGLNIPGFVESGLGGYTSLEYMHGNSTTTTRTTGKGVSCTVCNLDRQALLDNGWDLDEAAEYSFYYQMARWDSNLKQTNSSENVPIFGFVLSGVSTPAAQPEAPAQRIYGATRYKTSLAIADRVKELLGVDQFDNVILTIGTNYADATSGAYLSIQKNAPILMLAPDEADGKPVSGAAAARKLVLDYVKDNLKTGGTVYVLGGEGAVASSWLSSLSGLNIKRLAGNTRYGTNLEILKEAGVTGGRILVATGLNFPDSLSASAVNIPILLVNGKTGKLRQEQIDFLFSLTDPVEFIVLGGKNAVPYEMEDDLIRYGSVYRRIQGGSRYETSVMIAEELFEDPERALIARADEFPDGLCGGILAHLMNAPLILTNQGKTQAAVDYAANYGLTTGAVLGGNKFITDDVVRSILGLPSGTEIPVYVP